MKRSPFVAFLLAMSCSSYGQGLGSHELCVKQSKDAELIMAARMRGVPMSTVMEAAMKDSAAGGEPLQRLYQKMVIFAYTQTVPSPLVDIPTVAGYFRDLEYARCMQSTSTPAN